MIYDETLDDGTARVLLGDAYKPGCKYQLSQDRFEAAVLQWEPGVEEPTIVELKSDPISYEEMMYSETPTPKDSYVYPEDILADLDKKAKVHKLIFVAATAVAIVTCIIFTLGVHYGIFKI